jgi:hypothetical protein
MTQQLSPAAQSVWSAFLNHSEWEVTTAELCGVAAALRAAADQVVPEEQCSPRRGMRPGGTGAISPDEGAEDQRFSTRRKLLAIASELERQ